MTIRETAISKLHQLPESLLQEVTDFIDFIIQKHQSQMIHEPREATLEQKWSQWFRALVVQKTQKRQKVLGKGHFSKFNTGSHRISFLERGKSRRRIGTRQP